MYKILHKLKKSKVYAISSSEYIPWIGTFVWTILKVLHKLYKKLDYMQNPLMGTSYMPWVETLCLNYHKDIA
jgi:hypothetical protein